MCIAVADKKEKKKSPEDSRDAAFALHGRMMYTYAPLLQTIPRTLRDTMTKEKKYSTLPASEKAPTIQHWLAEHKARDLAVFKLPEGNPLADIVIIASASSARHARSLADGLSEMCKQEKYEILRTEGYQEGQWVLVDLNDIIVHIFQEPVRELYHLEALWSGAEALPATAAEGKENN